MLVLQAQSKLVLDFSSLIGPLFYMWIFQLPLPLIISELVLERENRIRQMMKLQGLDEISYMSATYLYHTVFYIIYAFCVFILGVALDLQFFLANSITLQIVFYLLYGILQVKFNMRNITFKERERGQGPFLVCLGLASFLFPKSQLSLCTCAGTGLIRFCCSLYFPIVHGCHRFVLFVRVCLLTDGEHCIAKLDRNWRFGSSLDLYATRSSLWSLSRTLRILSILFSRRISGEVLSLVFPRSTL